MTSKNDHKLRIKQELRAAGVTSYGLMKLESRNLHKIIQEDEHIEAVVYGRATTSGGAMLVATNLRVVYFNRLPLFATLDEVTYDLIGGVSEGKPGGIFASVTLHTRAGDYTIRFANLTSADKFIKYIEQKCIEKISEDSKGQLPESDANLAKVSLSSNEEKFLRSHEVATISTIDRNGNVDGAAVYYCTFGGGLIYVLTKSGTQKMHNVFAHPQVALTIYDESTLRTLQMQAIANVETETKVKQKVFKAIMQERSYKGKKAVPPVVQLNNGSFMIIRIHPTVTRFRDYKNFSYETSSLGEKNMPRVANY